MTEYHVLCSRPGLRRGGSENPAHAVYRAGDHTAEQLHALLDEPAIVVVIGRRLDADGIDALLAPADPAGAAGRLAKGKA